jgi:hypothetical protein
MPIRIDTALRLLGFTNPRLKKIPNLILRSAL